MLAGTAGKVVGRPPVDKGLLTNFVEWILSIGGWRTNSKTLVAECKSAMDKIRPLPDISSGAPQSAASTSAAKAAPLAGSTLASTTQQSQQPGTQNISPAEKRENAAAAAEARMKPARASPTQSPSMILAARAEEYAEAAQKAAVGGNVKEAQKAALGASYGASLARTQAQKGNAADQDAVKRAADAAMAARAVVLKLQKSALTDKPSPAPAAGQATTSSLEATGQAATIPTTLTSAASPASKSASSTPTATSPVQSFSVQAAEIAADLSTETQQHVKAGNIAKAEIALQETIEAEEIAKEQAEKGNKADEAAITRAGNAVRMARAAVMAARAETPKTAASAGAEAKAPVIIATTSTAEATNVTDAERYAEQVAKASQAAKQEFFNQMTVFTDNASQDGIVKEYLDGFLDAKRGIHELTDYLNQGHGDNLELWAGEGEQVIELIRLAYQDQNIPPALQGNMTRLESIIRLLRGDFPDPE